ncbi:scavenger receptor cysteine-rich domain superfamily protein-like [Ptychodera flava]|uniref:scavenger receptor cysteine-rich domain superfamily protein-like n=1 Tax=Ptychodera flava TaxID=63121 RepID=UPI00396A9CD2
MNSCNFTVAIIDEEKPSILCPDNINITTDPGEPTAVVNWTFPNATDNSGNVTVTGSRRSGTNFTIGLTTVQYNATDPSGNMDTCYLNVTVIDDELPIISCPQNIEAFTDHRRPTSTVHWHCPNASDNSEKVVVNGTHVSGSPFNVGRTVVAYNATDPSGNVEACDFNITVEDNEPPQIRCPRNRTSEAIKVPFINVDWSLSEVNVTDNVDDNLIAESEYKPGSQFFAGATVIKYIVNDTAGNVAFCVFTVNVQADLRLADGMLPWGGRLERLEFDNTGNLVNFWTVCNTDWNTFAADVACKELGYTLGSTQLFSTTFYGQGIGDDILKTNFTCVEQTSSLSECLYSEEVIEITLETNASCAYENSSLSNCYNLTMHPLCNHSNDVSILCQTGARLVGGSRPNEGRVEVLYNGTWGSVCDNGWDINDADVTCRQLGYTLGAVEVRNNSYFGRNAGGPIWLSNLTCYGNESNLLGCKSGLQHGINDCGIDNTAGVVCQGHVRLSEPTGDVEVFHRGKWAKVCYDGNWNINEGNVVCRELGFSGGAERINVSIYDHQEKNSWLSGVECYGHEVSLFHCKSKKPLEYEYCSHVAAVNCKAHSVRLSGGNTPYEGRLEVFKDGQWGTVCGYGFTSVDAKIVCKELGMFGNEDAKAVPASYFGDGSGPISMSGVHCKGSETSLFECSYKTDRGKFCDRKFDVGIICQTMTRLQTVQSANSKREGLVQVYDEGVWKNVSNTHWSNTNADVLCKELGYVYGAIRENCTSCPIQPSDTQISDLQCTGIEHSVRACTYERINSISKPAYAVCSVPEIHLDCGYLPNKGGLLMAYNDISGRVCATNWNIHNANVSCIELGYPSASYMMPGDVHMTCDGDVFLDDIDCLGHEKSIAFCPSLNPISGNRRDCRSASVRCNARFRLAGGFTPSEGRVEVYMNHQWGRVLNKTWNDEYAEAICYELGKM